MARRHFGTDGVRGVVGKDFTAGARRAARLRRDACGPAGGRVFVGRDTRASGVELEEAFARGVARAGGVAVVAGVLPTPAVALLALDLGVVISASHNPPEYNGVKFFDSQGRKLTDAAEEEIEALLDADGPGGGEIDRVERGRPTATSSTSSSASAATSRVSGSAWTAPTARMRRSHRRRSSASAPR